MIHRLFTSLPQFVKVLLPSLFCCALTLILLKIYIHPGVPITHDGENHLARFANYKVALREGQLPPRFAPNLYHRYGYPVFHYNYPLPTLLSLPFSLPKLPYQFAFKVIMSAGIIGVTYGSWVWLRSLGYGWRSRAVAGVALLTSPYLVQSVAIRGSIGEVLAAALVMWLLVWTEAMRKKASFPLTILGSAIWGGFFLSHNVMVLFATPVLLCYAAIRLQTMRSRNAALLAVSIGLASSLWFWLPAVVEKQVIVVGESALSQKFAMHFPTLPQLISSPIQFGYSYIGSVDSLSFALGSGQLFVLLVASMLLMKRWWSLFRQESTVGTGVAAKKAFDDSHLLAFGVLIAVLCAIFLQLSWSAPFWQNIPFARFIQFPWRMGFFVLFGVTLLVAWMVRNAPGWATAIVVALLSVQTLLILQIVPVGYINKSRVEYELFEQSTTTSNENLPKTFTLQDLGEWKPSPILLTGTGEITVEFWNGSRRRYTVAATTPVTVVEPTMYFPGWTSSSGDRQSVPISYVFTAETAGRIAYELPPGTYEVHTQFSQLTWPRWAGNLVSGITLLGVCTATLVWAFLNKVVSGHTHKKKV